MPMGEWNMEDMPLPALFEQARKLHLMALESESNQEHVKKGCEAFRRCEDMINKLGLFSSNETKEEISTRNLKYVMVPFYLAELVEKVAQDDRIQILKSSQSKLKEFISFCETLELVPEEEMETFNQEGSNGFSDRRAKKVARFKRQKAAESMLLEIKERKERRGRSTKATALCSPVETAEEDELDDDREEEREAWQITISLSVCKALDLLEILKREEEMLSAIKEKQSQEGDNEISEAILDERAMRAESWHRSAAARARFAKPVPPITCATFAQDVLEGRASVTQEHDHTHQPLIFGPNSLAGGGQPQTLRQSMAAQVFQPGHRMPSMSIEEAGLREMEMMKKWQERNAKAMEEESNSSSWYKETLTKKDEDEEDDDEEKARAWDDWKDENPRGTGNKKLTPCG